MADKKTRIEELKIEYATLCSLAGQKQYQIQHAQNELVQLNTRIKDINIEVEILTKGDQINAKPILQNAEQDDGAERSRNAKECNS